MADFADEPNEKAEPKTPKTKTKDHEALLKQARSDWDRAKEREVDNITLAYEDLTFLSGHNYSQWPADQRKKRDDKGRPVVQINHLPKFVHQITGDIRQMKPAIKVVPVDSGADEKTAGKIAAMVRYIENRSDASAVYFRAADSQVACGIGHWQVITEYADSSTFNQEIRIAPIEDGVSVLWDPDASLPSKEDAGYCFVPVDMSRKAFEAAYPDIQPASFDDGEWQGNAEWVTDDHVRIAAYWVKKPTKKKLALFRDGRIDDITDGDESAVGFALHQGARIEERESTKVCRYLITASDVLEGPKEWKGRFIPIIPVIGEEYRIGRKIIRNGIVRNAKDAQRMVNYFHAAHTETVALQPKAPFMVTELNVAKYQELWESANTENNPYLIFTPDPLNGGKEPGRIQPPVSSQGVIDGLQMAVQDLKDIIGIYDAGLGNRSNETSGVAIKARENQSDTGSVLYVDNFARAVRRTGEIIVDLIPYIYDSERLIRVMGEDGKIEPLEINKLTGKSAEGHDIYENDVTVGSYDVVAEVGPNYSTKREEAREGMLELLRVVPDLAPLIADKIVKAQDWPMADDIAKRVRATLPPKILQLEKLEKEGASPEQMDEFLSQQQQPPPDPKMIQIQADAQHKQAQLAADQQQFMTQMQLQMHQMAEDSAKRQDEMMANIQKMFLDSQTKIEVAQIAAGVGMHKTVVQAGTDHLATMTDAAVEQHKTQTAAETARHATITGADTARYATDNKPEPRAPQ